MHLILQFSVFSVKKAKGLKIKGKDGKIITFGHSAWSANKITEKTFF
jgi:hypothetical protein